MLNKSLGKWHLVSNPTGFDFLNILPGQGDRTPVLETYVSRKQGDPSEEPFGPGILRPNICYNFEPVPDGAGTKYILSGQLKIKS